MGENSVRLVQFEAHFVTGLHSLVESRDDNRAGARRDACEMDVTALLSDRMTQYGRSANVPRSTACSSHSAPPQATQKYLAETAWHRIVCIEIP